MIYLNDRLVPPDRALVSVYDHGFLYGDGIYETLRVYDGHAFLIDEHIARLFRSASMISLDVGRSADEIKEAVMKTVRANRLKDSVVRITVSRGAGPTGLDPALCERPTFVVMAHPFRAYPRQAFSRGVKIIITRTRRNPRESIDPAIKSLNFLNNILAKMEAKAAGAFEGVMLNRRGYLTEGTVSNIFFVRGSTLHTPSIACGILDGITRNTVLKIANREGIRIREGRYVKDDLYGADEVFLSNTTMEVMPVSEVDGIKIANAPGDISRMIRRKYREMVKKSMKGCN